MRLIREYFQLAPPSKRPLFFFNFSLRGFRFLKDTQVDAILMSIQHPNVHRSCLHTFVCICIIHCAVVLVQAAGTIYELILENDGVDPDYETYRCAVSWAQLSWARKSMSMCLQTNPASPDISASKCSQISFRRTESVIGSCKGLSLILHVLFSSREYISCLLEGKKFRAAIQIYGKMIAQVLFRFMHDFIGSEIFDITDILSMKCTIGSHRGLRCSEISSTSTCNASLRRLMVITMNAPGTCTVFFLKFALVPGSRV